MKFGIGKAAKIVMLILFGLFAIANISDILDMLFLSPDNPIWTYDGGGWPRSSKTSYFMACLATAAFYIYAVFCEYLLKNRHAILVTHAVGICYIIYTLCTYT